MSGLRGRFGEDALKIPDRVINDLSKLFSNELFFSRRRFARMRNEIIKNIKFAVGTGILMPAREFLMEFIEDLKQTQIILSGMNPRLGLGLLLDSTVDFIRGLLNR